MLKIRKNLCSCYCFQINLPCHFDDRLFISCVMFTMRWYGYECFICIFAAYFPGGFIYVNDLLEHRNFNTFTLSDIERVVINNDKRRFHIENDEDGQPKIRANQGHTLKVNI